MTATAADGASRAEISRARLRLGGLVSLLACGGVALLVVVAVNARELGHRVEELGALAAPALVLLGAALIVALVPASLVAGAAGYALGTAGGLVVALAAATAGAVLCSLIGRRAGTPAARHAFGSRVARSAAWLDARPLRAVVTARLLPGLPFNATSYVLGLTRIGFRDVAAGSAVGFAPRCLAYVALGGSVRDLDSPEAKVALGASLVLLVLVIVLPRLLLRGPRGGARGEEVARG